MPGEDEDTRKWTVGHFKDMWFARCPISTCDTCECVDFDTEEDTRLFVDRMNNKGK